MVWVLSLAGRHSPPHFPRMPSNTVFVSGSAVGAAQILICSYSCVFLPPMSTAIRTSAFSFVGAVNVFYIFCRHRVCLVDCVDLICSLYSWWEGFGSSSLATLPLGFNCGFISTSACGSSTGVCCWGCSGGLGSAPVRAGVEVVQLLGLKAFWQHQVLRGVGGQGSRKYCAPEGHDNQYWPIHSSILAWRTPLTEKPGGPQSTGLQRVGHT